MTNSCEFQVEGMHCAACELTIEKNLKKFKGVRAVNADLSHHKVVIEFEDETEAEKVRKDLSKLIEPEGYTLVRELTKHRNINLGELGLAFGIAAVICILFLLLQKLGLSNLIGAGEVNYPVIFLIGFIASLSTCMAVVGGLVLTISSAYAPEKRTLPLLSFHTSRIISFFILGGVIGFLGQAFELSIGLRFGLELALFLVMVIMGVSMLGIAPGITRFMPHMPKWFGRKAVGMEVLGSILTPVFLGTLTFFLPCGFTQSVQLYALTTGSFMTGALTMLVFALGTFPVLAIISFLSVKLSRTFQSGLFFKVAGFLLIGFAIFNLIGSLVVIGILDPVFNF